MNNNMIFFNTFEAFGRIGSIQDKGKYARVSVSSTVRTTDSEGNKIDETQWHNIIVFETQKTNFMQICSVGDLVLIKGVINRKVVKSEAMDTFVEYISLVCKDFYRCAKAQKKKKAEEVKAEEKKHQQVTEVSDDTDTGEPF